MTDDFDRFVTAQAPVWTQVLAELRAGDKRTHWMWFIFPQIAGLGRSPTAQHYAIRDADEARAYLSHPLLASRLVEAVDAVLLHAGQLSAEAIFGGIDAVKLRSSMTLFEAVAEDPVRARFAALLDGFYAGTRDAATLALID